MWERACSRIRSVSQRTHRLTHRIREQARSHIGFSGCHRLIYQPLPLVRVIFGPPFFSRC
ncbi:hypothetical protein DYL59_22480 [Pseudomonas kairouanensis]|uniref:Uncharacterized protein n=1 Tax=Pseudomonas kairouanensis TaxID=2293832 RepID=A0A4Z0AJM5_9PSED|nr:hypothetical protein DYL59_22480 [Pseudomonas kairouanensis]